MDFAGAYLRKAGLRDTLIEAEPHPGLEIIVTIPVYNEPGLERCLDSLFLCETGGGDDPGGGVPDGDGPDGDNPDGGVPDGGVPDGDAPIHAEVIILINAPADAPAEILETNLRTRDEVLAWINAHPHPHIKFHLLLDHSFKRKEAGVGMARKILMDEAARRFDRIGRPEGIIASMDADVVVEQSYLSALVNHFRTRRPEGDAVYPDGCSVYFEHPLTGEEFSPDIYEAITRYELHLRYYLQSLRSTSYPYAYHTLGSSFAVSAEVYCREGGMNRRQGGEDFYFIQKIAQRGNFSECNDTCVRPSPRPSDRVPFGTGPAVARQLRGTFFPPAPGPGQPADPSARISTQGNTLLTYAPEPFRMLAGLFDGMEILYSGVCLDHYIKARPGVLLAFLEKQGFGEALVEIRRNSASPGSFRKRFWRWFNMFRIMKFLHFARKNGYPDIPVEQAACEFLALWKAGESGNPGDRTDEEQAACEFQVSRGQEGSGTDPAVLLEIYRRIDRFRRDTARR